MVRRRSNFAKLLSALLPRSWSDGGYSLKKMNSQKKIFCFSLLIFSLVTSGSLRAQEKDYYTAVRVDWHLAGISECHEDWPAAIRYYQNVIAESKPFLLDSREWYVGTASYGIARCAAHIGDTITVRSSLVRALGHHFWNFSLIRADSLMLNVCGAAWIDSVTKFWSGVLEDERPTWQAQQPIMFYPDGYDSTPRWPLVIALHGGNDCYESFAQQWRQMAKELRVVVAVAPGVIRESQITNSWGSQTELVEKSIVGLVSRLTSAHLADPSQVYLTGFSQGAEYSIELSLRRPDIFMGAISMSGFVSDTLSDSTLAVAKRHGVRVYAITGDNECQTFHSKIESAQQECARAGIPFNLSILPGMTHEVPLDFHRQFLTAWNWVRPASQAEGQKEERQFMR